MTSWRERGSRLARKLLATFPEGRRADLRYLDLSDSSLAVRFNPLAGVAVDQQPLAAANLVEVMKKIWPDAWGPRLEHVLRNACLALLAQPEATLADILRLLRSRRSAALRSSKASRSIAPSRKASVRRFSRAAT